jgi:CheY-like chemotaxis protein
MVIDALITDSRPVLVVEDSDDDFDTVVVAAARAKVCNDLIRAAGAEVAWRLLARDQVGRFSFMLLDYDLRGLDGLNLLHQLRHEGLLDRLPVVVFTTSVNPGDRDLFCAAGASAFHVKSVQYTACLATLEAVFVRWLNRAATTNDAAILSDARQAG